MVLLIRRRTRLTPTAIDMCICLQHISSLEDEIEVGQRIHEKEVNERKSSPLGPIQQRTRSMY
ncbi:hypothetical protein HanIR_Chr11g0506621 [Helianthus annuus]|nr:hypothetical protein HanIR_Chr11g0506621 [Helianthus annuus]